MLDCKHASHLLSQSRERRLSLREWVALKLHLRVCDACRNFSRFLHLLRDVVRGMVQRAEADEAVKLSDEARERIRRALDQRE